MPRLTTGMTNKVRFLLNMDYTPAEIGKELGVTAKTIKRAYLTAGAPYRRDASGRIMIVGSEFYAWAQQYVLHRRKQVLRQPMTEKEAYCVRCNLAVEMVAPKLDSFDTRGVANMVGKCPTCGNKIYRFVRMAKNEQDQPE